MEKETCDQNWAYLFPVQYDLLKDIMYPYNFSSLYYPYFWVELRVLVPNYLLGQLNVLRGFFFSTLKLNTLSGPKFLIDLANPMSCFKLGNLVTFRTSASREIPRIITEKSVTPIWDN